LSKSVKISQNRTLKNPGNIIVMKKSFGSRLKVQLLIFLVLFFLAEIILRLFGMKPGTLIDDFKIEADPIYQPRFLSDEVGINHIIPNEGVLMRGSIINAEGFRGRINYSKWTVDSVRKATGKKVIMIIGDSFVEGCCADSVSNSFPDLIHKEGKYVILNFGVAGSDPVQYELIAKKYVKELMPDKVIVVFYFGNDILTFERPPSPGSPLNFPFRNNKWISSVAPNHLAQKMNYVFKNAQEAYGFYMDHYTLKGQTRNAFEKALSYSVIFSKIYLFLEHKKAQREWNKMNPDFHVNVEEITYKNAKNITRACDSAKVQCVFTGIPSPAEADKKVKLLDKYKPYFKEIKFYEPDNLNLTDYDGTDIGNHFNNEGHRKYAEFLKKILATKND
jgi:hypothetical protein